MWWKLKQAALGSSIKYARKFSEKVTFLTPWYAHVRVPIRGLEMLIFQKILDTYLIDGPLIGLDLNVITASSFWFTKKPQSHFETCYME